MFTCRWQSNCRRVTGSILGNDMHALFPPKLAISSFCCVHAYTAAASYAYMQIACNNDQDVLLRPYNCRCRLHAYVHNYIRRGSPPPPQKKKKKKYAFGPPDFHTRCITLAGNHFKAKNKSTIPSFSVYFGPPQVVTCSPPAPPQVVTCSPPPHTHTENSRSLRSMCITCQTA